MIDIDIQISISERSSGWVTNYVGDGNMVEDVDAVHDLDNDIDNYDCVNVMLSSSTRKDLIYKDYFNMLRPTGNDFLRTYYSTSFPKP